METNMIFKIILILSVMVTAIFLMNTMSCADDGNFNFAGFEGKTATTTLTEPVKNTIGAVLSVVRIVGTGVSIIILTVIAMKYMIAAPGDRADFKKGAIQYIVGAVIVFAASNIIGILVPAIEKMVS